MKGCPECGYSKRVTVSDGSRVCGDCGHLFTAGHTAEQTVCASCGSEDCALGADCDRVMTALCNRQDSDGHRDHTHTAGITDGTVWVSCHSEKEARAVSQSIYPAPEQTLAEVIEAIAQYVTSQHDKSERLADIATEKGDRDLFSLYLGEQQAYADVLTFLRKVTRPKVDRTVSRGTADAESIVDDARHELITGMVRLIQAGYTETHPAFRALQIARESIDVALPVIRRVEVTR